MRPMTVSAIPAPLSLHRERARRPSPSVEVTTMRGCSEPDERVDRVLDEVVEHLAQQRRVGRDARQVLRRACGSMGTPIDS